MPTKAKTCCGTSSEFSRFTTHPNSLQNKVPVFGTIISEHGSTQPVIQRYLCKVGIDERGELPGRHGEEPGSKAEAEGKGSELVNLPFEGHPEESPGLGENRDVEVCVLQIDAVHPHSWNKNRLDGVC